MAKQLIGLVGKKGSGKSEVAKAIKGNFPWTVETLKFASPLKNMTRTLLGDLGLPSVVIEECIEGNLKEKTLDALGKSPRHLMQTLGTEWGRDCISEDIWLDILETRFRQVEGDNVMVVVDDCRFINEARLIRSLGGKLIKIHRLGQDASDGHQSEKEMDFIEYDGTIFNDGSISDLHEKVKELFDV